MAETITVRFDQSAREVLEEEASRRGIGISTFVRRLAEAELKRVRREAIHAEAAAVAAYVAAHPTAFDDDDPAQWFSPPARVPDLKVGGPTVG